MKKLRNQFWKTRWPRGGRDGMDGMDGMDACGVRGRTGAGRCAGGTVRGYSRISTQPGLAAPEDGRAPVTLGRAIFSWASIAAALALAACGCQVLSYHGANGERFSRSSFGANTVVSSLTVEADTNGLRRVEMHGYQNDSSQALGAVTEAAVKAAVQSVR